ncbi:MAG: CdvA-like protein [Candidatus Bathyarchaeia archaeon]
MLVKEIEIVNKKKQALDSLFTSGRISKSTYDYLNVEINNTLNDVEELKGKVQGKMKARLSDLEKQRDLLERFIASLEISHAAEEIDNTLYERQREALSIGLESATDEIKELDEALLKLSSKEQDLAIRGPATQHGGDIPSIEEVKEAESVGEEQSIKIQI